MKKFKIQLNNRLEIIWGEKIYKSIVQDVSDNFFSISIPMIEHEYLPIELGTTISIVHYDERGNLFQYESTVIKRVIENNLPQLIMSQPVNIRKIQRRSFVRVSMLQVIEYGKIKFKDVDKLNKKAFLMDLSGGGMRIKVKDELQKGDKIAARIVYENTEYTVKGEVVRIELTTDRQRECGINFNHINENTRENIIKIVFDVMRKQRELL